MNAKRLLSLFRKDLKNGLRDNLFVYAILAPLAIAFLLRIFLPALSGNAVNVILIEGDQIGAQTNLENYAQVEYVDNNKALKERVLEWDDAVGLINSLESNSLVILAEGNEDEAVIEMVGAAVNKIYGNLDRVNVKDIDLGKPEQPAYRLAAIMMCLMSLLIGGMLTGFTMAEEKELNTRQALKVSPLREPEYIVGKTLTGMLVALVLVLLYVFVLGIEFSLAKLLVITIAGMFLSMIFGYLVGAISNNQLTAIANAKIGALFFIIPPVITLLISRSQEVFLYWIPSYWTYAGYRSLFWEAGAWPELLFIFTWNMILNIAFLLLVYLGVKRWQSV